MMNSRPTRKSESKGPMRRFQRGFARLTSNKLFLKIAAVVMAVIIWGIMVASDGTLTRHKTFQGATLGVTGEAALTSRGYIVTDNLSEILPKVDMVVEVTQANYDRVTASSYNPHLELTQITGEGENVLPIVYSSQLYGQVISCQPSSVAVNVERYVTRRIPVVTEMVGQTAEGLYLDSYKTDPTTLSVSGPQSLVTTVSRIVVRLDQNTLSEERMSDKTSLEIELQAADGTPIRSEKLTVTNQGVITTSVTVETELTRMRKIPLEEKAFVKGEPASGFELKSIELAERTMDVAGSQDILDAISMITTDEPLNIDGASEDVSGFVRIRRVTGIRNTLPTEVSVKAHIEETTVSKTLRNLPVTVRNLSDTDKATLGTNRVNVYLNGPYTQVTPLTSADIEVYLDAAEEADEGKLQVHVRIENAKNVVAEPEPKSISITVKSK